MTDLLDSDATAIAEAVRAGNVSAREVASATLSRIAARAPLNAFTHIAEPRLLAEADAVDRARSAGTSVGPLAGVPFAVKNLFDLKGVTTLAGAKIERDNPPAPADAPLVRRLGAAGATCAGALNMGEYAYDFTGENCHDGASKNPHDLGRMTGGSSGGSGAAVAGGLVPLALGSDTNGSIRVPASFCGIFGLKPTYGRLPRTGTTPFVDSLDHLGPLARSVRDLALSLAAMEGFDAGDPASIEGLAPAGPADAKGLRVARLGGWFSGQGEPVSDAAADAVATALGASDVLDLSGVAAARAAAFIITMVEGAALHMDAIRTRPHDFDPAVRDRLVAGALLPGVHYVTAQRIRRAFQATMRAAFSKFDVLVAPATPMRAPLLGTQTVTLAGEEVLLRPNIGIYTQPISFVGLPVVTCPVPQPDGLPIGVQLIAPAFREDFALSAAATLEAAGVAAAPPVYAGV
ncbi:MAG: AtzE family amidohydrolase [Pseudomonadota bacterium]